MSINTGTLRAYDVTKAAATAGEGQAPDQRRMYNFGDRLHSINPQESMFFSFLSKLRKFPTDDPVFRFLEDRGSLDWTSREFYLSADVNGGSAVTADSSYTFTVDDNATSAASIDWLIKGMTFTVNTVYGTTGYSQIVVRVMSSPVDSGTYTSFTGKIISLSNSGIANYNILSNNDRSQIVGSAYDEDEGAPDVFSNELDDDFGNCQYFKTAFSMSEIGIATRYRGFPNEWNRVWALKLREHKSDIHRSILFGGQRATSGNLRYTDSLVGHILVNSTVVTDNSALTYTRDKAYFRSATQAEMTYSRLLKDFEVIYDPARGGSQEKLAMASLPVITFFNDFASGAGFLDLSVDGTEARLTRGLMIKENESALGPKVMTIDTIHGMMHLTKEPLFRGNSQGFLALADLNHLYYRPLIGNGLNLDTRVRTNVQNPDESIRKDVIETVAGLEIGMPETMALYNIEGF